jgi:hypothetical protein
MKACLLVLTLVASLANAGEIGRLSNNAGGAIILTTEKCSQGSGWVSYGYAGTSNDTIWGCHFVADNALWIRWNYDNSLKRYSFNDVTWSPEFLELLKKNRKTY